MIFIQINQCMFKYLIKQGEEMKSSTTLKVIVFMTSLSPTLVIAEIPRNGLQVEYKKNIEQETPNSERLSFKTIYQIPSNTYHYLDELFSSFYNTITFNNKITDNIFKTSAHYELVSIPLISENQKGLQFEVFGNFSNPETQHFSNISADQALSTYYSNTEGLNIYNSQLSVGAGISFYTVGGDKIRIIVSNNKIPGYGSSTALLAFETKF